MDTYYFKVDIPNCFVGIGFSTTLKQKQPNLMLGAIAEYKKFHGIESVRPFKVNTGERKQWFRFDKNGDNLQVKQGKEYKKAYASDLLSILNGTYTFVGLKGE